MDYEKKYKEALDRARELHKEAIEKGYVDAYRKDYETIFPELAESEEERIRKALIELVGLTPDYMFCEIKPNKFIAYLEKQKEHQNNSDAPNESSWSGMISSSDKDKNLDEIAQDYVDRVKEYNPEPTWDLMQTAVCYGYYLAEQKGQKPDDDPLDDPKFIKGFDTGREVQRIFDEQKPVEWDIMDIQHVNTICDCLDLVSKEFPDSPAFKKAYDGEKAWLQGLPHRVNLQPAEWSEVDDEELSRIAIERSYDAYPLSKSNTYNNEWNAKRVGYNQGYEQAIRDFGLRNIVGEWANNRLKSLRPSWKPSEEQMEALEECGECKRCVKELYEQLKAL